MISASDLPLPSRLPDVGTTIFSVMSALAARHQAINLGQGFPDFGCDPALPAAVTKAMADGHNQYPPMTGWPALRQAIAGKIASLYGRQYDADTEITVTAGATQALMTALLALIQPGDEVIVIEPAYDSYIPAIRLAGGVPVLVSMEIGDKGYRIPWDSVAARITARTRLLMLNSPHNPTGTVLGKEDVLALQALIQRHPFWIVSDEVYEHMVFDGLHHESMAAYADLAERSLVVSSFGKTYHVTGWKVGYVAAPAKLMSEFRKVHQYNVFTVNTPMQAGIAEYMQNPEPHLQLSAFYQRKRDLLRNALAGSRFELLPCSGTYFQCVRYAGISDMSEADFASWLTREAGVAAIPVSAFYQDKQQSGVVRFCFAKQDATLEAAADKLKRL